MVRNGISNNFYYNFTPYHLTSKTLSHLSLILPNLLPKHAFPRHPYTS